MRNATMASYCSEATDYMCTVARVHCAVRGWHTNSSANVQLPEILVVKKNPKSCMVLTGVVDGPIKGGLPKAVELVGAIGVWCICECSSSRALGAQSAVGAGLTQLVLFWFAGGGV